MQQDKDGFLKVLKKSSKKHKSTVPTASIEHQTTNSDIDISREIRKIDYAKEELKNSEYYKEAFKILLNSGINDLKEILCFGLGHIGECVIARYQLAFLLCFNSHFNVPIKVHDPVFYKEECEILKTLGVEVLLENSEGYYEIQSTGKTIVYMPHCPKQLVNNFLWCNFSESLCNCVLICNSFEDTVDTNLNSVLLQSAQYILKITPYTKEESLPNTFKFSDIFNNTSVHTFINKLLPKDFWTKGEKPEYANDTEFITNLMIDKLKF